MVQEDYTGTDDRVPNNAEHEDEAGENAIDSVPLLQEDQREEDDDNQDEEEETPSPWRASSKSPIPMIVYLMFLMISLEFEESIQAVPTVRLYESAICQQYYSGPVDESKCKVGSVQQKLAWVRGWQGVFDALPSEYRKSHRHCGALTSPFHKPCFFLYPLGIWRTKKVVASFSSAS